MAQERGKSKAVRELLQDPDAARELVKQLRTGQELKKVRISLSSGKTIFATDVSQVTLPRAG
jgi:hypothetical protein